MQELESKSNQWECATTAAAAATLNSHHFPLACAQWKRKHDVDDYEMAIGIPYSNFVHYVHSVEVNCMVHQLATLLYKLH